jgi:hypothetical protein
VTVGGPAGAASGGATPWRVSGEQTEFFIRHAGRDTAWAEWLTWPLHTVGHSVDLDVWDWAPGEDFMARMAASLERAGRLLAVCTRTDLSSAFVAASCAPPSPGTRRGGSCRCW